MLKQCYQSKIKPKKPIPKISQKKKEKIVNNDIGNWYVEMRNKMTGYCAECGKKSLKDDNEKFTWSICHILPKSIFKSVATHDANFIELCWLHHQQFDSSWNNAKKMYVFELAKEKVNLIKPLIKEKHKILDNFN